MTGKPRAKKPSALRDKQKEITRGMLLDGARAAFESNRYADITIDDIATGAGTSRGTFYLYFSKAEALMELLRAGFHRSDSSLGHRSLGPIDEPLTYDRLRGYLAHHVNAWQEHRALAAAWMEGDGSDPDVHRMTDTRIKQSVVDLAEVITTQRRLKNLAVSLEDSRARAAVMDIQLQYVAYYLVVRNLEIDLEAVISMLAQQWYCALFSELSDANEVVLGA